MYEAKQGKNSQSRIIGANKQCSKPSHYLIQRLVLKYGGSISDTINEDSKKLAEKQNQERAEEIPVIDLDFDAIEPVIYDKMMDNEDIYIVSHGRASIGNFPAVLEKMAGRQEYSHITGEQGKKNINGEKLAQIIHNINEGLKAKDKSMGKVKIEACMSSMRRSTKNSFGDFFRNPKNSLIDDIYKHLSFYGIEDENIHIEGNAGFSKGLELMGDLSVTDRKHTEIGLLANILDILSFDSLRDNENKEKEYKALQEDARHIVSKYTTDLQYFKRYLTEIDKKFKDIDIIKSVNDIIENGNTLSGMEIIIYLSQYKGIDTSIYESFLYGLTEDEIWADLLYNRD